ncbi:aromatic ring-hydroxylating oxygenase subunit alpha [Haloplanus halophilus]|uniref:aromatic ring-hydroxylating oxygenase subunit alpha n=1 Tax=Haloplanus halophilus TaxID=2949993 RepID=UPI00203E22B1|nr:Rieske 2Fe-2S domain-containing protein [Haloplanus sp. GDY1]
MSGSNSPSNVGDVDGRVEAACRAIESDAKVPAFVFSHRDVWELELERIFGRSWVFVGHASEIPEPGDYRLRYIGTDPYIFVRDEGGTIRVLFNSCRHRGTEVCRSEKGNTSHFRCPYHGWTFSNDGSLTGVPFKETFREDCFDLEEEDVDLFEPPQVDSYAGFYFACLDAGTDPFDEWIGDFEWYLDVNFDIATDGWEVVGDPHRYELDTNWKLGAENFAGDTYHHPSTHHSVLTEAYGFGQEESLHETFSGGMSRLVACEGKHGADFITGPPDELLDFPADVIDASGLDDEQRAFLEVAQKFVGNLFPNFSFLTMDATRNGEEFRSAMSVRKWRPIGPNTTEIWNWILVPTGVSDEYREEAYRAMHATFSPSGNFEPDDYAVWRSIPDAAESITARKHDLETYRNNFQHLGMIDDAEYADRLNESEWPGEVDAAPSSDMAGHTVYSGWAEMMSGSGSRGRPEEADER